MTTDLFYSPVRRTPFVRSRLEVDVPAEPRAVTDWSDVTGAVLETLEQLEKDVRARRPEVRAKCGTTRGGVIELFAYCSFELPGAEGAEPLVAGVTVQRHGPGRLSVSADLCGDESGHVYLEEGSSTLDSEDREGLVHVAEGLAARLARRADEVVAAIARSVGP
jgi:hypothetical protein